MQVKFLSSAALLLLMASSALGQRSSPQFSFPPPGPSSDVFTSANGQDLGLLQPATLPAAQPQLVPLGAQSAFSSASDGSSASLLLNQVGPQLIAQSQQAAVGQPQPSSSAAQAASLLRQQEQASVAIERQLPSSQSSGLSRPPLSLSSLSNSQQNSQQSQQQQASSQLVLQQPANSRGSQTAASSAVQSQSSGSQQQTSRAQQQQQQNSAQQRAASSHAHAQLNHHESSHAPRSTQQQAPASQQAHQSHASHAHQSQSHAHLHQSARETAEKNKEAAIEAARRAEATAASLAAASGQSYQCPDSFGYFRHHKSCDKYYACENGTATLKLCGNGLMFDDQDPKRENCAYPFSVDCGSDRTDLEPPISTPHCPRLYGLFADPSNCRVFYSCWNGESSKYECPPGLAYDNEQRVCVWADLVDRCDQSEVSDGFVCPDPTEVDQPGHYTRHAHPTDCRKFYVCIEGVARPYGCSLGTVFNVDSLQCDEPENVSGCEKYYGDLDPKAAKKQAREGNSSHASSSPGRGTGSGGSAASSNQANH